MLRSIDRRALLFARRGQDCLHLIAFSSLGCPTSRWFRLAKAKRLCSRHSGGVGLRLRDERMNAERNRSLKPNTQRWGAELEGAVIACAGRTVASGLRSSSRHSSNSSASSRLDRVALFRAQLRSAWRRRVQLRVASSLAAQPNVAVHSESSAGVASYALLRSISLPNNTLVLTAQRLAPLGPRSVAAPAAQRGRWV